MGTDGAEPGNRTPGPTSVADLLAGACTAAIRDSLGEVSRAQGQRGIFFLNVELCLGDNGEPLWVNSSAYFQQKRHHKDAARERTRG